MNDILLSGYYGFGNAGDEAILEAAVRAFQKNGLKVAALSHTPQQTSRQFGITAFDRKGLCALRDAIKSSRLVLSGGGGLFQDTTSFRSLAYYLKIPFLAKRMGKKTMIFGQGIGPLHTALGKTLTRVLCNRFVDRITVRDSPSKEILISLGVKRNIEVTADLAFLFPSPSKEEREAMRNRFHLELSGGPFLGVVLRNWPSFKKHLPAMADAVSALCRKEKATPVLFSFQPGSDQEILETFQARIKIPVRVIPDALTPRELFALIDNLDFVVAMRYHAILFSACVLAPFFGISYDNKVANLANLLQAACIPLEKLSSPEFPAALERAWAERTGLQARLRLRVAELARKAQGNIEIAVELLNESLH